MNEENLDGQSTEEPGAGGDSARAGSDDGVGKLEKDRLVRRVRELEDLTQKAIPLVRFAERLMQTKQGRAAAERFQKGEDFEDMFEGKAAEKAAEKAAADTGLTKDQIKELLEAERNETVKTVTQALSTQQEARERNKAIDDWAKEKLPGYEKLRGTRVWQENLNMVFTMMQQGQLEPADGEDPFRYAVQKAYDMASMQNPDIGKKKPAAAKEEDRLAEILSGGRRPPSSKPKDEDDLSDLPEEYRNEIKRIRSIKGTPGVGRSFANPKA